MQAFSGNPSSLRPLLLGSGVELLRFAQKRLRDLRGLCCFGIIEQTSPKQDFQRGFRESLFSLAKRCPHTQFETLFQPFW